MAPGPDWHGYSWAKEVDLDLGCDHWLKYFGWKPDRTLNDYPDRPDIERLGAHVLHLDPLGNRCVGGVHFDVPGAEHFGGPVWQVESWDPLTISPSIRCSCGDHGWIKAGRWGLSR